MTKDNEKQLMVPQGPSVDLAAVMALFEEAKKEGWNVLIPQTLIAGLAENFAVVVAQTIISTDETDGEIYPDDNSEVNENKKYRLNKTALMRIAGPYCAGIKWWPRESGIEKIDRDYIAFKAVGSIMAPDGQEITLIGHDDLDFIVLEDKYRESYTAKAAKLKKKDKGSERPATPQEKEEYINYCVNRDLSQKREHKLAIVETGAMERVIRAAIGLKNSYTLKQLRKPFITARIIMRPDYSRQPIRSAALAAGNDAAKKIFNADTSSPGNGNGEDKKQPTAEENAIIDFQNSDQDGQIKAIKDRAQRVGYSVDNYLQRSNVKSLTDFTTDKRLDMFKYLLGLPLPQIKPEQQTLNNVPY